MILSHKCLHVTEFVRESSASEANICTALHTKTYCSKPRPAVFCNKVSRMYAPSKEADFQKFERI